MGFGIWRGLNSLPAIWEKGMRVKEFVQNGRIRHPQRGRRLRNLPILQADSIDRLREMGMTRGSNKSKYLCIRPI